MKTLLLTIFFLFSLSMSSVACFCSPISFCETSQNSLAVLEVKVIAKYEGSPDVYRRFIDFKVLKTISSQDSIEFEHLTLVEYNTSCDIFLFEQVDISDKLIINYQNVSNHEEANHPTINFISCRTNHLAVKNGFVEGDITEVDFESDQKLPRKAFLNNVKNLCNLRLLDESLVLVGNNMVDGNIDIENKTETNLNFEIFSSAGQVVYSNEIASGEKQSFPFLDYPADIYFIRFRSPFRFVTKRIAKFY